MKVIFCDLCLKEIDMGNRPTTQFNKEGWMNLTNAFRDKTGRDYNRMQLKNKWDQLKKDWKLWKELKRGATGLGWCPIRKTIDASEEWWAEKLEVLPNARKFRIGGIDPELEEKLDTMFSGVVATGTHARTSTMEGPSLAEDSATPLSFGSSEEAPNEGLDATATRILTHSMDKSIPKRKRGRDAYLKDGIDSLLHSYSTLASSKQSNRSTPMMEAVKLLQNIPEIRGDKILLMRATTVLENPTKRDTFVALDPELRADYITYQLTGSLE